MPSKGRRLAGYAERHQMKSSLAQVNVNRANLHADNPPQNYYPHPSAPKQKMQAADHPISRHGEVIYRITGKPEVTWNGSKPGRRWRIELVPMMVTVRAIFP